MLIWQGRSGAVSRSGICLVWFRGRHISPSMPYREEGRYLKEAKGQLRPKAIARAEIPGWLVWYDAPASCLEVLRFSLLFKHSVCSVSPCVNVLALGSFSSLPSYVCAWPKGKEKSSGVDIVSLIRTIPIKDVRLIFTRNKHFSWFYRQLWILGHANSRLVILEYQGCCSLLDC